MLVRLFILVFAIGAVLSPPLAAQSFGEPEARVVDEAEALSPAFAASLERRLATLKDTSNVDFVAATTANLDGLSVDEYAFAAYETRRSVQPIVDKWVVFLISLDPAERSAIIVSFRRNSKFADPEADENARADELTTALLDVTEINTILNDHVAPYLRIRDFDGAVKAGVDAVIATIDDGDQFPERDATRQGGST